MGKIAFAHEKMVCPRINGAHEKKRHCNNNKTKTIKKKKKNKLEKVRWNQKMFRLKSSSSVVLKKEDRKTNREENPNNQQNKTHE